MKQRITSIFLTLVLTLCLVGNAFAAGAMPVFTPGKELPQGVQVAATLGDNNGSITLNISGLKSGNQYLVLMVAGIFDNPADASITQNTIKYIDQKAQADGTLEFKVYPNSMQDSTILLSGNDVSLTILGTVDVPYVIGDVDGNGEIELKDSMILERFMAGWSGYEEQISSETAADIDRDGEVTLIDCMIFARYLADWPGYSKYFEGG